MKKILCVIDFRGGEEKALEVAAELAGATNAHLLVLYPYRLIGDAEGDIPSLKHKLETDARKRFDELRKTLKNADLLSIEFEAEIGFVVDRIMAHVRKTNIDLVIISLDATAGMAEWKAVTLPELIAHSNLPFLVIPAEVKTPATVY